MASTVYALILVGLNFSNFLRISEGARKDKLALRILH